MTSFAYSKTTEGEPVLILDGEPVDVDATVTIQSTTLAALLEGSYRGGAEACAKGVEAAWPEIAAQLGPEIAAQLGKANGSQRIEIAGLAELVEALRVANQRPIEVSTPARVTRQTVKRDREGRIVETVAVAEDVT
jgi:hypothetical protein